MKTNLKKYGVEHDNYFIIEPNTGVKVICDNYRQFVKYYNKWYCAGDVLAYKQVLINANVAIYNVVRYRNNKIRFVCNNATSFCFAL